MVFKRWIVNKVNKELVKGIAEECDIDPFVALLAVCRGIDDPYDIEEMLSDDIYISDPYQMADMDKAVEIINEAIESKKLIAIYGDYDCDGVASTAMLYDYLRSRGARVIYYIPNREDEGYGMSTNAIESLYNRGVELIITVDNGISAHKEVEFANSLGITTVITDHHLPTDTLPTAAAVIDCHRNDCMSEYKELCGAGVAFKLISALDDKAPEEMIDRYGDLAAIATIGDIMPLIGENRAIVKAGIKVIQKGEHTGVLALAEAAGLKDKPLSSSSVSFGIVPRINAAGRMKSAEIAVKLLIEDDYDTALKMAEEISQDNITRQEIEQEIIKTAVDIIENNGYHHDRVIVVEGDRWHQGVVGIVAARLTEKYSKPAIVLSVDGDEAVGSARGIEAFSIFECIKSADDILVKYGGHKSAAGLTVKRENITALRRRLNEWAEQMPFWVPTVNIDCLLNPAAISMDMAEITAQFEPFGAGNRTPLFGVTGLKLERITPVGNGKHLRLLFSKGNSVLQGMLFSLSQNQLGFDVGDIVDIAFVMSVGTYNGAKQLNLVIKHIRAFGVDDSLFPEQLELYDRFVSGKEGDFDKIAPTRDDIALTFRTYCAVGFESLAINRLLKKISIGKILICRDILLQIGVLLTNKDKKFVRAEGVRSDLNKSSYYVRITGGDTK